MTEHGSNSVGAASAAAVGAVVAPVVAAAVSMVVSCEADEDADDDAVEITGVKLVAVGATAIVAGVVTGGTAVVAVLEQLVDVNPNHVTANATPRTSR